ncbi:MAG: acetyltransferase [Gammaproteobacteria bacterium]
MTTEPTEQQRHVARQVRDACVRAALEAYEQAGMSGLCHEGAWECAVGAMRSLDLDAVLAASDDSGGE